MIKFRAWDKENRKIRDILSLHTLTGMAELDNGKYKLYPDEIIVMQSTGHFDINSQEIFEGDLLDTSDPTGNIISSGNPILEVCFDGLEFTVKGNIENGEMSFKEFKEICELAGIPLKVIGNVYENRDLLENLRIKKKKILKGLSDEERYRRTHCPVCDEKIGVFDKYFNTYGFCSEYCGYEFYGISRL